MLTSSSQEPPPRRRVARSFGTVVLGMAAIVVVLGAIVVSLYLRYVRFDRVAASHVLPDAVLVVRLEVAQVALYEPVRRHLIPLLGGPGRPTADAEAALGRIEEHTGLKRGDLREVVVARGAERGDWVMTLGGIFPRGTSAALLAAAFAAEDPGWASDGSVVVYRPLGIAVARAPDGAILVASSITTLRAALPPGDTATKLGLSATGPGGFAMQRAGVLELVAWPSVVADEELARILSRVDAIQGAVTLEDRPALTFTFTDSGDSSGSATVEKALGIARAFPRSGGSPVEGLLRAGADRAVVPPAAAGVTGVARATLIWERAEVDQWFAELAEAISDHWRR